MILILVYLVYAGCSIKMNKITKEAHATTYYHEKIDELINRQVHR
jgi:uncharacterized protein YceK